MMGTFYVPLFPVKLVVDDIALAESYSCSCRALIVNLINELAGMSY